MKANSIAAFNQDGSFTANYQTRINFYEDQECASIYRFQQINTLTFEHEANESTVIITAYTETQMFEYLYFNTEQATVSAFDEVSGARIVDVEFTSSNPINIEDVIIKNGFHTREEVYRNIDIAEE